MELQCVESLGPDPSSAASFPHQQSFHHRLTPTSRSIPVTRFHHSLSPLTCTPTSSPKRRRISYTPTLSPQSNSAPSRTPLPLPHPLQSLAQRDLPYAIQQPSHLNGTAVTPDMREEVVAWCSDMTDDLHLPPAIVAIAINLFDRFLVLQPVSKNLLYPLTASCLLLASKVVMDQPIACHEIASRSRVTVKDIQAMECVVLNVLSWRVNVVTPHEVVQELISCFETQLPCHIPLLECLLLNCLSDYGLAWLRATSIGVACFVLCSSVTQGRRVDLGSCPVVKLASECGVDTDQVKYCINWLRESMHALFSEVEKCDSE